MAYDYASTQPKRNSGWRSNVILFGGAIALVAAALTYFSWQRGYWAHDPASDQSEVTAGETDPLGALPAPSTPQSSAGPSPLSSPQPAPTNAEEAAEAVVQMAETQGGIDQRLAAAEQRLAKLDLQAQAASGNTARAEGLLIAFASRRALERGAELGYLADQLRLRFGDALPNAVAVIIAMSRDPVTLDQLVARLEGLAPKLAEAPPTGGWEGLKQELRELFIVRRETAPSPQPTRRLDRARLFLESGRVEAAIAEVRNLPGAGDATSWLTDAERYAEAMRALDLIETSAVLEPRQLRDGTGTRIDQPSPVTTSN